MSHRNLHQYRDNKYTLAKTTNYPLASTTMANHSHPSPDLIHTLFPTTTLAHYICPHY
jgi:hypothetical protein